MNVCTLSGKLVDNAVVNGAEFKALFFTVLTKYGYNTTEKKDRVAYVPCVMWNPNQEIEKLLVENGKGLWIEVEGRVARSSYEENGQRKFNTEVVVKNRTLNVLKRNGTGHGESIEKGASQ